MASRQSYNARLQQIDFLIVDRFALAGLRSLAFSNIIQFIEITKKRFEKIPPAFLVS